MKRLFYCFLMAALMVSVDVSCKKEPKGKDPSVKTLEATDIKITGATLNAEIDLADGEFNNITCGFYWGTSEETLETYLEGGELTDGAFSASISELFPNTQYWYKAYAELDDKILSGEIKNFTTEKIAVPEAVDLGVVVNGKNIKWASFNLGATTPEEYGFYYAWGETEPKSDYSWSEYKFGQSESGPFSKYNTNEAYGTVDNNMELDTGPEGDDAASKLLGGKWRMPTYDEMFALAHQCTFIDDTVNGVNGRKAIGPNNKSIFFPFAGFYENSSLNNAGSKGYYWTSSLYSDDYSNPSYYAFEMALSSGKVSSTRVVTRRFHGQSIRPVYED